MISKKEFLKQIKEKIFPLISKEVESRISKTSKIVAAISYILVLMNKIALYDSSKPGDSAKAITAIIFEPLILAFVMYALVWDCYKRHKKKELRPIVFNILNAISVKEKQLKGISVKQLRKIHFLPKYDSRDKDEVNNDSFGLLNEKVPFYIQEVSFSTGGKHPKIFQGPVVRFFLKHDSNFKLMIAKRDTLLPKDRVALSTQKALDSIFGSQDWQPLVLESVKFNDNYFAYTNDQIKARSILTPKFMEHIHEVERIYHAPVNILFYENQLILAIKTNRNMFEFFKEGKKINLYENFYDEIETLYQFQDFFKLK